MFITFLLIGVTVYSHTDLIRIFLDPITLGENIAKCLYDSKHKLLLDDSKGNDTPKMLDFPKTLLTSNDDGSDSSEAESNSGNSVFQINQMLVVSGKIIQP